eukprot:TRINITY_DN23116_c0_g1_i1.p1 TRINITY_DN23116_c0_g1~~TRINITY_DN23116_c0_g1_i1.p1  ORF type:complete len:377 (+),score=79.89 TRINITY_DN23116_c0_g1_i1:49-1179(+)
MAGLQLELPSVRSPPKPLASLTPRRDYLAKTGAVHLVEEAIVALTAARPDDPRSFLAKYFAEDARESAKAGPADSDLRCLQLTAAENAAEVKRRGRRRRTRVLLLASAAHEPGAASRFVVGRQHGSVLTAHGDLQAHALGERLRKQGVRIGSAICSPQLRARRTAEIVLGHLETTPAVRAHPGARERSMGGLVGKPLSDLLIPNRLDAMQNHGVFWRPPGFSPEDGEPGESDWDVERRMATAVDELLMPDDAELSGSDRLDETEKVVAVFTHPGCVRAFCRSVLGGGAAFRFRVADPLPCSVTELQYDPTGGGIAQGWRLLRLGDAAHLEGLPQQRQPPRGLLSDVASRRRGSRRSFSSFSCSVASSVQDASTVLT